MLKEFRNFAMRGNVVDLGVGIIIGAAFGKIVSSFVNDVLMPPIGLFVGGVDFTGLKIVLKQAADGSAAASLNYGNFIQTVVDFTIVAFAVFLVVKGANRLKAKEEAKATDPAEPPAEVKLLSEIRDLLKK
jgi:large conductance mechanosensitive channel